MTRTGLRRLALALTLSLTATSRLAAQSSDAPAESAVFVARLEPRVLATIDVPVDPLAAPSPDGRYLAALQTRPAPILWIVPTDGRQPFNFRKTWAAYKARWASSGNRIGFIAAVGPPRIWTVEVDPQTGRPTDPPRLLHPTGVNAFAFSPDGGRVAFVPQRTTAAGASEIHIVEWESRRSSLLLRETGMIYRLDWSPDGELLYYGVAPAASDSLHRVVRSRLRSASTETVARAPEFLGLAPDGLFLLLAVETVDATRDVQLDVASADGDPWLRVAVPRGLPPTWGPTSASLIQVRPDATGTAILTIPVPALWFLSGYRIY